MASQQQFDGTRAGNSLRPASSPPGRMEAFAGLLTVHRRG
eukprot:CAMPEP_0197902142 /NCGR_PEP_ID=MMETSP1439-20131203/52684_1 /TAXON_ID=66791 /ORGANISM="Gonyaulax spinifera, Strain CCMP409" /LENGTH=39 /DNA_ID= /DNA_START= /DNA_END= /DNA_ORIENTATION=